MKGRTLLLKSALAPGKLRNELLARFLADLELNDPSILVSPGVGEDVAVVRSRRDDFLVLKSDPITLATDAIGYYAVVVNINDLATSGAAPRWFLSSLLFPPGAKVRDIRQVMRELSRVCRRHGLTLCGGHTEITDAVVRPIVVGMAVGTVSRRRLVDKRRMTAGDHVLLTKGLAVEGTCVIARETPERLRLAGMSRREIRRCQGFLTEPGISIVEEARIAADSGKVTAMHDVTEGGLATALEELSIAGKRGIRVYMDRIPVLEETRRVCLALRVDPLGLLGSGSLLICCDRRFSDELARSIRRGGIEVTCVGEVTETGAGVEALDRKGGGRVNWPRFEVDEIARLFLKESR